MDFYRSTIVDKLVLRFVDIDEQQAQNVKEMISGMLQSRHDVLGPGECLQLLSGIEPKVWYWKTANGNHRSYTFTFNRILADMVYQSLSFDLLRKVREIHVKEYHQTANPVLLRELKNRLTDGPMFRNVTIFGPSRQTHNAKVGGLPGIRIGHRNADVQLSIYGAANEPFGTETRCKDNVLDRLVRESIEEVKNGEPDELWRARITLLHKIADKGRGMLEEAKSQVDMLDAVILSPALPVQALHKMYDFTPLLLYPVETRRHAKGFGNTDGLWRYVDGEYGNSPFKWVQRDLFNWLVDHCGIPATVDEA